MGFYGAWRRGNSSHRTEVRELPCQGLCELVVRYNSGLQVRTTCWCPALSRGWVVQPEPYAALCQAAWQLRQGRSAEYGVLHRCGPVELLCRRVQVTRIARPKQTELGAVLRGHSGTGSLSGPPPGNFIRWASGSAARGEWRVQQGRQAKKIWPSLFPVEKIWAAIDTGCGSQKN